MARAASGLIVNVAQHLHMLAVGGGPALDGGGAANECAQLNVREERFRLGRRQGLGGPGYGRLVAGRSRPTVMMGVRRCSCRFGPQRKCVVADVVVEIDEARDNEVAIDVDDRCGRESGRRGRITLGDVLNIPFVINEHATLKNSVRIVPVTRYNAAGNHKSHEPPRKILKVDLYITSVTSIIAGLRSIGKYRNVYQRGSEI